MIASTSRTSTVAVVGNPNCGKTTLFNGLTGSRQRIGNWPGVTVEKKEGILNLETVGSFLAAPYLPEHHHTEEIQRAEVSGPMSVTLVDLPGIYSVSASSEDERVARDFILSGEPDLVVNIVDASNLQRNLYLTVQLIEMRVPLLVVLNMVDLAESHGISVDADRLSRELGCPVVAINATRRDGIAAVKAALAEAINTPRPSPVNITYPAPIEALISGLQADCAPAAAAIRADARWVALKLIEQDPHVTALAARTGAEVGGIVSSIAPVQSQLGDDLDVVVADARYEFIHSVSSAAARTAATRESITDRIDRVVLNRFAGIPVFLLAMYVVFWVTIAVGSAFIDFFEILSGALFVDGPAALLDGVGAPQWLITMLAGGIGGGIQTVATFVPVIFMMFFMLSLLEDSGYMARAAFVMDRFMRLIGLPGKSFVPMMVGFGCTVPAIMGTRTLESTKDRYMTIAMAPFMSCGARLPVYALFAAAFFPALAGQVVFSLYVIGIILAVITGLLLKHTLFRGEASHFIMELPPYHAPRLGAILGSAASRLKLFVVRAGSVIVVIVAVLAFFNSLGIDGSFGNEDSDNSVLTLAGSAVTPVFAPMGISEENWPATVGLFTGLFAKEVVVGTLNALYTQDEFAMDEEEPFEFWPQIGAAFAEIPSGLLAAGEGLLDPLGLGLLAVDEDDLLEELETSGGVFERMRDRFSPQAAYAYLLFILIYTPCVAALAAAIREMGHGYAWLMAGYQLVLAWAVATLFYQLTLGGSALWTGSAVGAIGALVVLFAVVARVRDRGSSLSPDSGNAPGSGAAAP